MVFNFSKRGDFILMKGDDNKPWLSGEKSFFSKKEEINCDLNKFKSHYDSQQMRVEESDFEVWIGWRLFLEGKKEFWMKETSLEILLIFHQLMNFIIYFPEAFKSRFFMGGNL